MSTYNTYNEKQLVTYMRRGDKRAFEEIYNRYWELLTDTAYHRLHSREDAEEVVQEVFVGLYMRREQLVLTSTLEAYLKTALKYKVIDVYRSQQRYYQHLDDLLEQHHLTPSFSTPEQYVEFKELEERVGVMTNKLPEKCRDVFMLSRFEQLSHQEIAERMDISISTVKKHIHKALYTLRSAFGANYLNTLWIIGLLSLLEAGI